MPSETLPFQPFGELGNAKKWSNEELFQAAKAVAEMRESPGWAVFQRLLENQERLLIASLTLGDQILKHEEYAARTAVLKGIKRALFVPEAVAFFAAAREKAVHEQLEAQNAR